MSGYQDLFIDYFITWTFKLPVQKIQPTCVQATQSVWTLFYSNLYGHAHRGPRSVKKSEFFLQIKPLSFWAKIAPKRHKLWKIIKIEKKNCFLRVFQIFFNLGALLVHQTSNGMFSGPWRIFWHPRDPWGRIHIDCIKVLVIVFNISERWLPLQLFSTNSK